MERIAVTGGAGFLGSNLAKRLLDQGREIVLVDNLSSGSLRNLFDLGVRQQCVVGDLRDYGFAVEVLRGIDTVYHLAAEVGGVEYLHGSLTSELSALQTNLVIDTNVFRSCVENRVNCIIYASSVAVYPQIQDSRENHQYREEETDQRVDPEGGYGWSKLLGEKQLSLVSDMCVGIGRIFHSYGKNICLSPARSQVIGSLIRKAIFYPKEKFVVWGDGSQRRSFVHVEDVVEALLGLKEYVLAHQNHLTVNIGSQDVMTIADLANKISHLSGKEIAIEFDRKKPTGATLRKPSFERARASLVWSPKIPFDQGLSETFEWALKRLGPDISD